MIEMTGFDCPCVIPKRSEESLLVGGRFFTSLRFVQKDMDR